MAGCAFDVLASLRQANQQQQNYVLFGFRHSSSFLHLSSSQPITPGTRAMLGAGIALLLSEKLSCEQRRAIGWTLVAVGALTTISLALQLLSDDE
jgi:hypothetical protein